MFFLSRSLSISAHAFTFLPFPIGKLSYFGKYMNSFVQVQHGTVIHIDGTSDMYVC
jgi:hypothetical protein